MDKNIVILLAEDDLGHAKLLKKNFERAGVSNPILHFLNGDELINYLTNTGILKIQDGIHFVLILDIKMPKVDGIGVLKSIKNDNRLSSIPIIIFSTTDDPREMSLCYELGANGYIVKPVLS